MSLLSWRLGLALGGLLVLVGLGVAVADPQRAGFGGAPPAGRGSVDINGPVRVIDGDTIEVIIDGRQTAVGLIGLHAPVGNTDCGRDALKMMRTLTKGGFRLEEDPSFTFDDRGRRMYRLVTRDGKSSAQEMVRAGLAFADTRGPEVANVVAAQVEARAANRGCVGPRGRSGPSGGSQDPVATLGDMLASRTLNGTILSALGMLDFGSMLQASAVSAAPLAAITVPSGFAQDVIATGLSEPTSFTFLPDGRMLISEKAGRVKVLKNGALLPTPFIDIHTEVNDYYDRGLLNVAIDPNFATNGYVYLLYTYENNGVGGAYYEPKSSRLTRVTAAGDVALVGSEVVLLGTTTGPGCSAYPTTADCIPSDYYSHSIGSVKFAADGTMFVTSGDGANFNNVDVLALRAQDVDSLAGKMYHVTSSGAGLTTNPFWNGDASANRSKVWARGLRNSYRFTVKPGTSLPFAGDVGWGDWEEINVVSGGVNLGWPCYEGNNVQSGYQAMSTCTQLYAQGPSAVRFPLVTWDHSGGSAASTGGVFYTGSIFPSQYQGAYFYGDYGQSWIRSLRVDANNNLIAGSDQLFASGADGPVFFEMGPDQQLYYISIVTGQVRRIRYAVNTPPNAVVSATPTNGLAPLAVQFSSAGSNDPNGTALTYRWDFGDGSPTSSAANPAHTYTVNGTYPAALTLTNGFNVSSTATVSITVGNRAPTATINAPSSSLLYKVGDTINFSGSGTDPEDGAIASSGIGWQVIVHHCPSGVCHTHFLSTSSGPTGSFVAPDHGDNSYLEIVLTVTDSGGLKDSKSVSINPQTVQITVTSAPTGLQVVYDGAAGPAPIIRTTSVGSAHTVYTLSPQGPGNNTTFSSWSDGGAQQHNVIVPASNVTYTANFTVLPTITFDDLAGQDTPLNGQYPTGVVDWGGGNWFHSGPWGPFSTKSLTFNGPTFRTAPFTFMTPKRLLRLQAFNGGSVASTVTLSCTGNPTSTTSVGANQVLTIDTGWTAACAVITLGSTNGWDTNFDNLIYDAGGPDITPPVISAVQASNVTSAGTTITWNTDEASDTQIDYGTTTGYGSSTTLSPGLVINHSQGLGGLAPSTLYHYRVKSRDAAGNLATSGDFTFTTATNVPPVISAVQAGGITSSGATITWTTDKTADTQVDYGLTSAYGTSTTLNASLVTSHTQAISGLAANTLYHYRVNSRDGVGNLATSADFTFTTATNVPPVISAVQAGGITTSAATITWTTDKSADTQVDYGLTIAYGSSTTLNASLVTSHSQAIAGLAANTLYHYRVKSRDGVGNLATSGDFTFTTLVDTTPPVISAVTASGITNAAATITWTTDKTSDSQVDYGTTNAYGSSTTLNTSLVTSHSQALSGLTANTLYHYRVKSRDGSGNLATSADFTFTTSSSVSATVTFDDLTNINGVLNGQYPNGVINWGTNLWYLSGPWSLFTTNSVSFNSGSATSVSFSFVAPRRLISVQAFNGGSVSTTITLSCAGQTTKTQTLPAGQMATITTGWTATCTTVTVGSTNGWDTNFDNLVHDGG